MRPTHFLLSNNLPLSSTVQCHVSMLIFPLICAINILKQSFISVFLAKELSTPFWDARNLIMLNSRSHFWPMFIRTWVFICSACVCTMLDDHRSPAGAKSREMIISPKQSAGFWGCVPVRCVCTATQSWTFVTSAPASPSRFFQKFIVQRRVSFSLSCWACSCCWSDGLPISLVFI